VVERGAEAVQEGDGAEPRAGSTRRVGSSGDTGGRDQSPLDLRSEPQVPRQPMASNAALPMGGFASAGNSRYVNFRESWPMSD